MRHYGLEEREWQAVRQVLAHFPHVRRAVLFGSRAKGTNKPFSDVDIALEGDALTMSDLLGIIRDVDDLGLPYEFDFCLYAHLRNAELRSHIERCGVEVFPKQENELPTCR